MIYLRMILWLDFLTIHLCGSDAPKANPAINDVANQSANLGLDALNWYKDIYNTQVAPQTSELWSLTRDFAQQQMDAAATNQGRADELWKTYVDNYKPIQEKSAQEILEAGGVADQNRAAGRAVSDVRQQAQIARASTARDLASMGVNPNSGRFTTAYGADALRETAAAAGGATNAREAARDKGIALRLDGANTGAQLATTGLGFSQLGTSQGANAVNSTNNAINTTINGTNMVGTGYSLAQQGLTNKAGILNTQYNNQLSSWNAGQQASAGLYGGFGTLAGMAASKYF